MPTYSYSCMACDENFERLLVKIDERDDQRCKKCSRWLQRGIDRPGLVWSPTRNNGHS